MASSSDAPLGLESHPKMDIDDAPSLVGTSKNSMFRTGKVLCFVLVLLERQYWQRKECINRLLKIFQAFFSFGLYFVFYFGFLNFQVTKLSLLVLLMDYIQILHLKGQSLTMTYFCSNSLYSHFWTLPRPLPSVLAHIQLQAQVNYQLMKISNLNNPHLQMRLIKMPLESDENDTSQSY